MNNPSNNPLHGGSFSNVVHPQMPFTAAGSNNYTYNNSEGNNNNNNAPVSNGNHAAAVPQQQQQQQQQQLDQQRLEQLEEENFELQAALAVVDVEYNQKLQEKEQETQRKVRKLREQLRRVQQEANWERSRVAQLQAKFHKQQQHGNDVFHQRLTAPVAPPSAVAQHQHYYYQQQEQQQHAETEQQHPIVTPTNNVFASSSPSQQQRQQLQQQQQLPSNHTDSATSPTIATTTTTTTTTRQHGSELAQFLLQHCLVRTGSSSSSNTTTTARSSSSRSFSSSNNKTNNNSNSSPVVTAYLSGMAASAAATSSSFGLRDTNHVIQVLMEQVVLAAENNNNNKIATAAAIATNSELESRLQWLHQALTLCPVKSAGLTFGGGGGGGDSMEVDDDPRTSTSTSTMDTSTTAPRRSTIRRKGGAPLSESITARFEQAHFDLQHPCYNPLCHYHQTRPVQKATAEQQQQQQQQHTKASRQESFSFSSDFYNILSHCCILQSRHVNTSIWGLKIVTSLLSREAWEPWWKELVLVSREEKEQQQQQRQEETTATAPKKRRVIQLRLLNMWQDALDVLWARQEKMFQRQRDQNGNTTDDDDDDKHYPCRRLLDPNVGELDEANRDNLEKLFQRQHQDTSMSKDDSMDYELLQKNSKESSLVSDKNAFNKGNHWKQIESAKIREWMATCLDTCIQFWYAMFRSSNNHAAIKEQWFDEETYRARRLMTMVLDVLDLIILPHADLYTDPLTKSCIAWLQIQLMNYPGSQLLRLQIPNSLSNSSSSHWFRSCSAIAVAVKLLHQIVMEQQRTDHLPATAPQNAALNPIRDQVIRFFYELLSTIRRDHDTRNKNNILQHSSGSRNKKETFSNLVSQEYPELFPSSVAMLLSVSSTSACKVDSAVERLLTIQMEELMEDE